MTIMVIAASVVASVSPWLDWHSLLYLRCNQKQNITFSYGFSGGRKLKPALFLPQEEVVCYLQTCATCDGNSSVTLPA